jgi:myo-inositol-1(or 4)-monophosphatase
MMELEKLCIQVRELVENVGHFVREERKQFTANRIETKGKHDFVTYVDKYAEEKLVKELGKLLPGSGFIAEEGTGKGRTGEYNWIIDPLDGTTNYIHGSPPYAISVALMRFDEVILGVVYEIVAGECFFSFQGADAFMNDQIIKVSQNNSIADSLIATGFPYNYFNRLQPFMKTLEFLFVNSQGVRRLGSAATDLAYVACGRYDVFYEYNLNPWDVAAGSFLVQQAGGRVSDFTGGSNFLFGKEIIASNQTVFREFQSKIDEIMNQGE